MLFLFGGLLLLLLGFVIFIPYSITFLVKFMPVFFFNFAAIENRANFISSLSPSFSIYACLISFSCLVSIAKTSRTKLNYSAESGHSCMVLELSRNASNFPLILAVGLSYTFLIMWKYSPSLAELLKAFIMKGCCI